MCPPVQFQNSWFFCNISGHYPVSCVPRFFVVFCCWSIPEKIVEKKTTVETWLRWVNFCLRLWSSELPSQNMQILQKYSKKCQIFVVLRIRPQGQQPNSKAFKWQLMDYSFRNFSIYDHIRYILRTSDTNACACPLPIPQKLHMPLPLLCSEQTYNGFWCMVRTRTIQWFLSCTDVRTRTRTRTMI